MISAITRQKGETALEYSDKYETNKFLFPVKCILNEHA